MNSGWVYVRRGASRWYICDRRKQNSISDADRRDAVGCGNFKTRTAWMNAGYLFFLLAACVSALAATTGQRGVFCDGR